MEIEALIPPINIWLNYKLNMEALHMACLADDHPILCHVALKHRNNSLPPTPPPLPPYIPKKRYRHNPATRITTCITRISNQILKDMKCITPHTEPPWRTSEIDIPDCVQIFTPPTEPGNSFKDQWKDDHLNFMAENDDNPNFLFIYSDSLLTEQRGRRRTGFGLIGYIKGHKVFEKNRALREHAEVFDAEMAGIQMAAEETRRYLSAEPLSLKPSNIIFYTDNMGAINRIFDGALGKAQDHSRTFQKTIRKILNDQDDIRFTISWCPM